MAALSFGIGLGLTGTANAQHNLPAMNAMGRFFGIGWNHGFHSGQNDGRFQATKNKHPASMYASQALLYPFHPSYMATPQSGTSAMYGDSMLLHPTLDTSMQFGTPFGVNSNVQVGGGAMMQSGAISNQAAPIVAPAVPAEPAPTWLRPFLKDDKAQSDKAQSEEPDDLLPERNREEVSPAEVKPVEASPSDRSKSKAAEVDDDLLLPSAKLTPMQRYYEARQRGESQR